MSMFICGTIMDLLSIGGIITMAILLYKEKIWFGAGTMLMAVFLGFLMGSFPVMSKGVAKYEDTINHELQNNETVIQVIPTTASLPLKDGDTVKIYGYTEDGTIFEDNIDKEYTIYSVEDRFSISPVDIRCSDVDAEELSNILEKSKKIEIKKVE